MTPLSPPTITYIVAACGLLASVAAWVFQLIFGQDASFDGAVVSFLTMVVTAVLVAVTRVWEKKCAGEDKNGHSGDSHAHSTALDSMRQAYANAIELRDRHIAHLERECEALRAELAAWRQHDE